MKKCYAVVQVPAFEVSINGEAVAIELLVLPHGQTEFYVAANEVEVLLKGEIVHGHSEERRGSSPVDFLWASGILAVGKASTVPGSHVAHRFVIGPDLRPVFELALRDCAKAILEE